MCRLPIVNKGKGGKSTMKFFVLRNGNIVDDFVTFEEALECREYMQHRCSGDFTVVPASSVDFNDTRLEQSREDDMYIKYQFDDDLER